jgi:hypothetical protein
VLKKGLNKKELNKKELNKASKSNFKNGLKKELKPHIK